MLNTTGRTLLIAILSILLWLFAGLRLNQAGSGRVVCSTLTSRVSLLN